MDLLAVAEELLFKCWLREFKVILELFIQNNLKYRKTVARWVFTQLIDAREEFSLFIGQALEQRNLI